MGAINGYTPATLPYGATDTTIGTQGGQTVEFLIAAPRATLQAAAQGNLTAPGNTTAFFMQGLNGNLAFTPTKSGNVFMQVTGTIISPSGTAAGNGIQLQLSYGNGTAPVNGAALTGTQVGAVTVYTNPATVTAADVHIPFTNCAIVTGLPLNTKIWIDEAAMSVATASSMGIGNVTITAFEL